MQQAIEPRAATNELEREWIRRVDRTIELLREQVRELIEIRTREAADER
jgi:hypothetical protein